MSSEQERITRGPDPPERAEDPSVDEPQTLRNAVRSMGITRRSRQQGNRLKVAGAPEGRGGAREIRQATVEVPPDGGQPNGDSAAGLAQHRRHGDPDAERDRRRAAEDRRRAAEDRIRAADDRARAAVERARSERDRVQAARDRAQAAIDREASEIDELTRVRRRGSGMAQLQREIDRARRGSQGLAVAFVDVDGLKLVNDTRGHHAGDLLLQAVADALRAGLRSYDVIMRIGGDEFVCVLPQAEMDDVRRRFAEVSSTLARSAPEGSITVGLARLADEDTAQSLVNRADADLLSSRRRR